MKEIRLFQSKRTPTSLKTEFAQVSNCDYSNLMERKWQVKHLHGSNQVCRLAHSGKGDIWVLMAQDVLGLMCEVYFCDGNPFNCQQDNVRPINRGQVFIYQETKGGKR